MESSITHVHHVLTTLLGSVATTAARTTGFVQRPGQATLTGDVFLHMLTFTLLHRSTPALSTYVQTAAAMGHTISPQAVHQRFTDAAASCIFTVLNRAFQLVVAGSAVPITLLQRFPGGVMIQDSTTIAVPRTWEHHAHDATPASAALVAALKLQCMLDLLTGRLRVTMTHPHVPDQVAHLTDHLTADTLYIADRGYWSLAHLADLSERQIQWMSRMNPSALIQTADGLWWRIDSLLTAQSATTMTIDVPIRLGKTQRVAARLIAIRVPPEVAADRHTHAAAKAKKKQRPLSSAQKQLAQWTVFVTNLPPEHITLEEALVLARSRWQIELLFKAWKSLGAIDMHQNVTTARQRCEFYGRLLAVLVQYWVIITCAWEIPDRSLTLAAQALQRSELAILWSLDSIEAFSTTIGKVRTMLHKQLRIVKRKKAPSTVQLLGNPFLLRVG